MIEVGNYLVHLVKCSIHDLTPKVKPDLVTFDELYIQAKRHNIESMVFYAIEKLEEKPESILYKKWQERKEQNILKSILQDEAEKEVVKALTAQKINIAPLKGSILKNLYPQEDYRQMSDIDILYEEGKDEVLKVAMESAEYQTIFYKQGVLGVYDKPPYISIECHARLVKDIKSHNQYFQGIWGKLIQDSKNPYLYRMSDEDFAIYMLTHHAKHYYQGGCGIRPVLDIYMYFENLKSTLNMDFIDSELKKLKLYDFKVLMMGLAYQWFGSNQEAATELDKEVLLYIYTSGAYGSEKNRVNNSLSRMEEEYGTKYKIRYSLKRLFPAFSNISDTYPILKKWPICYPVCWVHRFVKRLLGRDGRVRRELKIMWGRK